MGDRLHARAVVVHFPACWAVVCSACIVLVLGQAWQAARQAAKTHQETGGAEMRGEEAFSS
eukprot:366212-Chlamydomonas_euryale.AAC.42